MKDVSYNQRNGGGDFPHGPGAGTPWSQCRGPGFVPWSGNQIPQASIQCIQLNKYLKKRKREDTTSLCPGAAQGPATGEGQISTLSLILDFSGKKDPQGYSYK